MPTYFASLWTGNAGSVMVSVEVGRSSWPTSQPLVTLLPAASLVSPEEWRAGKNRNSVRMFKPGVSAYYYSTLSSNMIYCT